ncbi:MAG TPA: hypothetical protein VN030_04285, partial [Cellvibrio sp.]|nr:hypothetical protein [Cellvibrio sp.]
VPENNILGVYKVTDRTCNGSAIEINACESIVFIEFVKGSFYKIADDEIAFVIWSGEKGDDLLYQARKFGGRIDSDNGQLSLLIDGKNLKERVIFLSSTTGIYSIERPLFSSAQLIKSELKIEKASASDLKDYSMEYPGNK